MKAIAIEMDRPHRMERHEFESYDDLMDYLVEDHELSVQASSLGTGVYTFVTRTEVAISLWIDN